MKCRTWFLSAALLAALAVAPVLAADAPAAAPAAPKAKAAAPAAPAAAAPAKPPIDGDLADMVRECKLTDEQVAKLAEAGTRLQTQLAEWRKTNADKIARLNKAIEAAQSAKDEAALAKVRSESMLIFQEQMNLTMKGLKGMMDILTPEQRSLWWGFVTFRELMAGMASVGLTTEQVTKIREICNAAGKDLDAIKEEGEAGMAAMLKVRTKVQGDVREKVLTAEQRTKLPPPITEAPAAPTKGATPPAAAPKAAEK